MNLFGTANHGLPVSCLAISCVLLLSPNLQAVDKSAPYVGLPIITFSELRKMVLSGREVKARTISAKSFKRVLEEASTSRKDSPNAGVTLSLCRIVEEQFGDRVVPTKPRTLVQGMNATVRSHFERRNQPEVVLVTVPIELSNTVFEAEVDFKDVVLQSQLRLKDVTFYKAVSFQGAFFNELVIFKNVSFADTSDFSNAQVQNSFTCQNCDFRLDANFAQIMLMPGAFMFLTGEQITAPIDFSEADLSGVVTFEGAARTLKILNKVYFNGINRKKRPEGSIVFKNVDLSDNLYLNDSSLRMLDFAETQSGKHRPIRFRSFSDFRGSSFAKVDLSGAEFDGPSDFSGAIFHESINLERITIEKPMMMRWSQIQNNLGKPQPNTSQLQPVSRHTYDILEANFKMLDDLQSQNNTHYDKQLKWEGRRLFWPFVQWTFGYFVVLKNPAIQFGVLVIVFWAVNAILFRSRLVWHSSAYHRTWLERRAALLLTIHTLKFWEIQFPPGFNGRPLGKVLFFVQSMWMKFVEVVLVLVFSNSSHLGKELLPYFFPK